MRYFGDSGAASASSRLLARTSLGRWLLGVGQSSDCLGSSELDLSPATKFDDDGSTQD